MTVRYTGRALFDLQDILKFIEKDSQVAADRLRVAIAHTVSKITA